MVNGSARYLIESVPIMRFLFIAGGLTQSFYNTFNNEVTNGKEKMKEFSLSYMTAIATLHTSLLGIAVGQVAIPVPFLGSFVGGIIGGYLGSKSGGMINSTIQNKGLAAIIDYLKASVK